MESRLKWKQDWFFFYFIANQVTALKSCRRHSFFFIHSVLLSLKFHLIHFMQKNICALAHDLHFISAWNYILIDPLFFSLSSSTFFHLSPRTYSWNDRFEFHRWTQISFQTTQKYLMRVEYISILIYSLEGK